MTKKEMKLGAIAQLISFLINEFELINVILRKLFAGMVLVKNMSLQNQSGVLRLRRSFKRHRGC